MNSMNDTPAEPAGEPARTAGQRILHPIRQRENWPRTVAPGTPVRRYIVLDTETTGLDLDRDRVIEICAASVAVDEAGRIVAVERIGTGLEDPGHSLSREINALTGLSDADLAGQSIDREQLTAFIEGCAGVVAFNSAYDRPMVEKLLPALAPMPWGCAWADVPWRALGFEPGPQNYLLMQALRYNPAAHRARDDVLSLIALLDHVCADGETVMAKVIAAMAAPAWRFEAAGAAYGYRHDLKAQRYRWAPEKSHRLWHKHVRMAEFRSEYRWYKHTIGKRPVVVPLPATQRYRANETWMPTRPKVEVASWRR
jgi:DNA polymerase-3 subunit epsilon